jgi:hypothetical protein
MPAHAVGLEVDWAHGRWNVQGELQKFVLPYTVIPSLREQAGYAKIKRVLHPRWYIATRGGYTGTNSSGRSRVLRPWPASGPTVSS